ncbi:hypothetical protein GCM10023216_16930 [Isoptericola chiayiensis]|uniref:PucR family transcriptional regulator n=1 Tax=Isoptericola chiayiensis TaxID=579446 RepID=A0ABP8YF61_9MICO|nr:helix-turn-helix domain-containing protein [Isoptericola chiayiensis]NOV99921.1 hypothetical protein [Isoptericola chiayiensis]
MPHAVAAPPRPAPSGPAPGHRTPLSRHLLVASLLDGSCRTADVRVVAARLGLPLRATYRVVALGGGRDGSLAATRAAISGRVERVHWHMSRPVAYGLVLTPASAEQPLLPAAVPAGVRLGVGLPVDTLVEVPEARRQADLARRYTPAAGGAAGLEDHLTSALVGSDAALATCFADRVLGALLACEDSDTLLATLEAWVAAGGSTPRTATALGCHRNTVTNRLRRLGRLTGRRTDRPAELVDLVLAVRAHRLGGPD